MKLNTSKVLIGIALGIAAITGTVAVSTSAQGESGYGRADSEQGYSNRQPMKRQRAERRLEQMSQTLGLSEQQQSDIRSIIRERRRSSGDQGTARQQTLERISAVLTDDQRVQWQQMREQRRQTRAQGANQRQ